MLGPLATVQFFALSGRVSSMKYLVYGIQKEEDFDVRRRPRGVDGIAVSHWAEEGLAAVYSTVPQVCRAADVPRLLSYARVVEDLCRQGPVLPLRYGCLLESTNELTLLLRRNREAYHRCLENVRGCVEMGVRVLPADADLSPDGLDRLFAGKAGRQPVEERAGVAVTVAPVAERPTGVAYLAARRSHFDQKDAQQTQAELMARNIQSALAGLFVEAQAEPSAGQNSWLVSIHFLVRCEEVGRFRAAVQRIEEDLNERLLLSGPWPPYHFVT